MRVTALAGGTGAAKLLRGLLAAGVELTAVVNTGDDTEVWGLHVSPDLDTITYALAGRLDLARGWGRADESFHCLESMAAFEAPTWFALGDRDLATHLVRTQALAAGRSLSQVTAEIARRLGVGPAVVPMSDDRVRTRIRTPMGWLTFQEYFVRDKAQVDVLEVAYDGAADARSAPDVPAAIAGADAVVVCPSNPVTSVGPILAVPGIAAALETTRARIVAVSPIVGGAAVSGPAGQLMAARGLPVSPLGVARAYAPWLDALLIARGDADCVSALRAAGVEPVLADILMTDRASEAALARAVLDAVAP
ncbi:MAG TPA: 2-phospho-L-lactate transferase [Candidatus Acidoferrum sp.]|nr:2-phospho-L-lactate transferase [Candidatus Acidoferrum sp.]